MIRLKNVLIVVSDIEYSVKFYKDIFGLDVIADCGENVILMEGLVLQDAKVWKEALGREVSSGSNSCELYFEARNIEEIVEKLERLYPQTEFVNRLSEICPQQKMIRFYDPDGNLIEIRTPA